MKRLLLIFTAVAGILSVLHACAGSGGKKTPDTGRKTAPVAQYRDFPMPSLPSSLMDREAKAEYLAEHYWEAYFAGKGVSDTSAVLGVKVRALEQAMANYLSILDACPLKDAQKSIRLLFDQVCEAQIADSSCLAYVVFRDLAERYMYDPNSPLRNEDYFLPYVSALATSPLTEEDLRPAYEFQARMCSMNQAGTRAPDFKFKTKDGRIHNLHGIQAGSTVLFFSNPGCTACKEIVDALLAIPNVENMVLSGQLAIVNIYIDQELDKWEEYLPNYPSYWICGYDHKFILRDNLLYNVRAIPSLYLLDCNKKIICKDAPTEKVIFKLNNLLCQ